MPKLSITFYTDIGSDENVHRVAKVPNPELRPDFPSSSPYFEDHIRWYFKKKFGKPEEQYILKSLNYKVNSYSLDLALKTTEGYFIVKDFKDKVVTLEDLKQLVKIIRGRFKDKYQRTNVGRVICVAKQYDQSFLQQESLGDLMEDKLRANFKIDLLIEEKVGYSVLWVDH
jgi:hypothetical protein